MPIQMHMTLRSGWETHYNISGHHFTVSGDTFHNYCAIIIASNDKTLSSLNKAFTAHLELCCCPLIVVMVKMGNLNIWHYVLTVNSGVSYIIALPAVTLKVNN